MSLELRDVRLKVTPEIDCALRAYARASGREIGEVAREVLQTWADQRFHEATIHLGMRRAEGLTGASRGIAGSLGADTPHASLAPELDWEIA